MGMYYYLRLYKGTEAATFREEMSRAAETVGGSIKWNVPHARPDEDLRLAHNNDVHTVYLPYNEDLHLVYFQELGRRLRLPWLEIRIQDGSIWTYTLYRGKEVLDTFSVCPQYWDADQTAPAELEEWQGKPDVLSKAWNLPIERVEKYLVNWGYRDQPDSNFFEFRRTGKAYPTDEHPYGDYEQFFDVLKVLGGVEPREQHTIKLPKNRL